MKPRVAVIMSTYNGEKYLKEQIESILNQDDVELTLYVRDDGSNDKTGQILYYYKEKHDNIHFFEGTNIGVGNSFMELLYTVPDNYNFYCFADQDDIWLPQKIITAVKKIRNAETPYLYCSNQTLVDQNLRVLRLHYKVMPDISYKQIICQNKITGCTMVWNELLQRLLCEKRRRPSKELLMNRIHDVWVAMVAAVTGNIIYDHESYIMYRQHGNNVVGVRKTFLLVDWLRKLIFHKDRNGRSMLCNEILSNYGTIIRKRSIRKDLDIYSKYRFSFKRKKILLNDKSIVKYSKESMLEFRMKVILNLF